MKHQDGKIELADWLVERLTHLQAFVEFWQHGHEEGVSDFPLHMLRGDWDEQFDVFCDVFCDAKDKT